MSDSQNAEMEISRSFHARSLSAWNRASSGRARVVLPLNLVGLEQMRCEAVAKRVQGGLPSFAQHSTGDFVFERAMGKSPHLMQGMAQEQQSMRVAGGTVVLLRAVLRGLSQTALQFGTPASALRPGHAGGEVTAGGQVRDARHVTVAQSS